MMSESRMLCAVAKYAFGRSNPSGENDDVNSAWYVILDATASASDFDLSIPFASPTQANKKIVIFHTTSKFQTSLMC